MTCNPACKVYCYPYLLFCQHYNYVFCMWNWRLSLDAGYSGFMNGSSLSSITVRYFTPRGGRTDEDPPGRFQSGGRTGCCRSPAALRSSTGSLTRRRRLHHSSWVCVSAGEPCVACCSCLSARLLLTCSHTWIIVSDCRISLYAFILNQLFTYNSHSDGFSTWNHRFNLASGWIWCVMFSQRTERQTSLKKIPILDSSGYIFSISVSS